MTLQKRLFTFFIAIVGAPLLLAGLFAAPFILGQLESRAYDGLRGARNSVSLVYGSRVSLNSASLKNVSLDERFQVALLNKNYTAVEALLQEEIKREATPFSWLVLTDSKGSVLADAITPPKFLRGVPALTAEQIAGDDAGQQLLIYRSSVPISSPDPPREVAWNILGGFYLDANVVASVAQRSGDLPESQKPADVTILIDSKPVASTLKGLRTTDQVLPATLKANKDDFEVKISDIPTLAVVGPLYPGGSIRRAAFVTSVPKEATVANLTRTLQGSGLALMILFIVAAGGLGYLLARQISQPLMEVADAANAIAAGEYGRQIEVHSSDEVGQLAHAFNDMSEKLNASFSELRESREDLKRAFTRFGETLRSTHDLERLLEATLEAAMDTVGAEKGLLVLVEGGNLVVKAWRKIDSPDFELPVGKGVMGYVVETGTPVRIPGGGDQPTAHLSEPPSRSLLSVPLYSEERIIGAVSVYNKKGGHDFSEADMGTILSLADQAGVAIENVLLHQEAQHLAIMDGQIGIPNNRYFMLQLDQEIQRSSRFNKPFSMIMLDIDDFKSFNDTYGHQIGDFVLIELATRVKTVIRDIDMFARYGGEEFTVLLPETDATGGVRTAERIRSAIADKPFEGELAPEPLKVNVTVGVAAFPLHAKTGPSIIRAADVALLTAKRRGKNQVLLYEPGLEL